jgi:hypothetical protein
MLAKRRRCAVQRCSQYFACTRHTLQVCDRQHVHNVWTPVTIMPFGMASSTSARASSQAPSYAMAAYARPHLHLTRLHRRLHRRLGSVAVSNRLRKYLLELFTSMPTLADCARPECTARLSYLLAKPHRTLNLLLHALLCAWELMHSSELA